MNIPTVCLFLFIPSRFCRPSKLQLPKLLSEWSSLFQPRFGVLIKNAINSFQPVCQLLPCYTPFREQMGSSNVCVMRHVYIPANIIENTAPSLAQWLIFSTRVLSKTTSPLGNSGFFTNSLSKSGNTTMMYSIVLVYYTIS